jgi:hypothetical protein
MLLGQRSTVRNAMYNRLPACFWFAPIACIRKVSISSRFNKSPLVDAGHRLEAYATLRRRLAHAGCVRIVLGQRSTVRNATYNRLPACFLFAPIACIRKVPFRVTSTTRPSWTSDTGWKPMVLYAITFCTLGVSG